MALKKTRWIEGTSTLGGKDSRSAKISCFFISSFSWCWKLEILSCHGLAVRLSPPSLVLLGCSCSKICLKNVQYPSVGRATACSWCQVCLSACPRCGKGGVPLEIHAGITGVNRSQGVQPPLCWALLGSVLAKVNSLCRVCKKSGISVLVFLQERILWGFRCPAFDKMIPQFV